MSKRNGDRARFQKYRKRKLAKRRRIQALASKLRLPAEAVSSAASERMLSEGGPLRAGD